MGKLFQMLFGSPERIAVALAVVIALVWSVGASGRLSVSLSENYAAEPASCAGRLQWKFDPTTGLQACTKTPGCSWDSANGLCVGSGGGSEAGTAGNTNADYCRITYQVRASRCNADPKCQWDYGNGFCTAKGVVDIPKNSATPTPTPFPVSSGPLKVAGCNETDGFDPYQNGTITFTFNNGKQLKMPETVPGYRGGLYECMRDTRNCDGSWGEGNPEFGGSCSQIGSTGQALNNTLAHPFAWEFTCNTSYSDRNSVAEYAQDEFQSYLENPHITGGTITGGGDPFFVICRNKKGGEFRECIRQQMMNFAPIAEYTTDSGHIGGQWGTFMNKREAIVRAHRDSILPKGFDLDEVVNSGIQDYIKLVKGSTTDTCTANGNFKR